MLDEPPNLARALRRSHQRTLRDVANAIGRKPSALSQYERTGKGLAPETIASLAGLYGLSASEIDPNLKRLAEILR